MRINAAIVHLRPLRSFLLVYVFVFGWVFTVGTGPFMAMADEPDFNRDILPVLSENCFSCHGPDEKVREAGLRLDQSEAALGELDSGGFAIVPGDIERSALIARILSDDEYLMMPPPDSGKKLSDQQIQNLKDWVAGGAKWEKHWAFVPPVKPELPTVGMRYRPANSIDLFIYDRLQKAGLEPEPMASKETLIRRVTLDLTGLPPTVQEVNDFITDDRPDAYERLVDRLLASKKYGEHMGRVWLDAARYADTHGLHLDNERQIWPYRNWVIDALNRNMPFDQFTIEQLAGDLLPQPRLAQKVATGFNRCNVTTSEGGSIDEEYYVRYAVDRVETTSTVWLGLTAGCASCHDHKFDPLSQKEFYQLFSYFYSLTERAMDGNALLPPPSVKVPTLEQSSELEKLNTELTGAKQELVRLLEQLEMDYRDPTPNKALGKLEKQEFVWFDDALPEGAVGEGDDGANSWKFVTQPEHPVFSGDKATVRTGTGLTQHFFTGAKTKFKLGEGDVLFAYVFLDPKNPPQTVQLQFNNGSWEHRAYWGADKGHAPGRNNESNRRIGDLPETGKWVRLEVAASQVGLPAGSELNGWAFTQFGGTVYWDKPGRVSSQGLSPDQRRSLAIWEQYREQVKQPALPADIQKILDVPSEKRNDEQSTKLRQYYLKNINPDSADRIAAIQKKEAEIKSKVDAVNRKIPSSLVMEDRKQMRQAHILERGEYTMKREPVASAVPQWISPSTENMPGNRLGLAQWLVKRDHPLTSRVTVNRYWQHFFGTGLVKTSEDFGIQGERPSHPELLDWLAIQFIESGWNVKKMHKLMVMSSTYRQSSRVSPKKRAIDPANRLLARGPRFRLDAEVIRDQALAISGLLVDRIGGPSVKPYQPAGLWKPVGFGGSNTAVFKRDNGAKLYRRSMYTFWKRTSPPPSMSTFDAPDRETCQVRRARTNTPLQALVLMNDVQFVEAARKFAEKILATKSQTLESKIDFAFRSVVARFPSASERQLLVDMYKENLRDFQSRPGSAEALLKQGDSPRDPQFDTNELAAWTMIAHLIFNLSETVTRS